ncbi:MAG: hypothetical protein [Podoviridae sp. ctdb7]|nr:MAG: hypothetical protein [Podoviridae sp. ctdb7]
MDDDELILQQREDEQRLLHKRRIDDITWQMGDLRGRRFVWELLKRTHYETAGETLFRTHGGQQSYLLGAYEVGRNLSEEIRALRPQQYLLMVQENTQKTPEE